MRFEVTNIVRKNVRSLQPYSTARDNFRGVAEIYLDANENPFNNGFNRYPDSRQVPLKKALARLKDVRENQIILGNGSDEIIDLLIRAFCEPLLDNVVIPQPTYGMYGTCAEINNVEIRQPGLGKNFELDIKEVRKNIDAFTKLIFLCSPNNPTGNVLNQNVILSLLESFNGLLVADEAYIDFADTTGLLKWIDKHPNLIVIQTFSKAWGLAGIRLGIGYGSEQTIGILTSIKPPYNISTHTQEVALKAIGHYHDKDESVNTIRRQRTELEKRLPLFSFVEKVFPSQANFLLVKVKDVKSCYAHLCAQGIIVRDRSTVLNCKDCLRITIGTQNENKELLDSLDDYEKSLIY